MNFAFRSKPTLFNSPHFLVFGYLIFWTASCTSVRRAAYFQDVPDSLIHTAATLEVASYDSVLVGPDDILDIQIRTIEPGSSAINSGNLAVPSPVSGTATGLQQVLPGFLVDRSGYIDLPVLGAVHVTGLTIQAIRDTLGLRASRYFKDPVLSVRLANLTINILGEVARPGRYVIPKEKVCLLEAFAMAGDLTIYARRDNILIIRNIDHKKQAMRLNLNASSALASPYFFLKQGDIIFIEPNKARITASTDGIRTRNYALVASGLSVLIILISRLTF